MELQSIEVGQISAIKQSNQVGFLTPKFLTLRSKFFLDTLTFFVGLTKGMEKSRDVCGQSVAG